MAPTGSSSASRRGHATTPFADATIIAKIHGRSGHGGGKPTGVSRVGSGGIRPKGKRVSRSRCQVILAASVTPYRTLTRR